MGEQKNKGTIFLDSLGKKGKSSVFFDFPLFNYISKYKKSSVLFSASGKTESFFTQDSKLYITPDEYRFIKSGQRVVRINRRFDSLNSRIFENTRIYSFKQTDIISLNIKRRYANFRNYAIDLAQGAVQGVTPARMWNMSVVGAVLFGMLTMTMIYRYLGQSVSAKIQESQTETQVAQLQKGFPTDSSNDEISQDIDLDSITQLLSDAKNKKDLEKDIMDMVKGYPIEAMVPEIAKKDRKVAAFIIGIAKKESNWGKRVPVLDDHDCYNYWGYRGVRDRMGTGGHTCFDSTKDAVDTVAKRIEYLISNEQLNTPAKMVVWKCGYDCSWDKPNEVKKWISDVNLYFQKLN